MTQPLRIADQTTPVFCTKEALKAELRQHERVADVIDVGVVLTAGLNCRFVWVSKFLGIARHLDDSHRLTATNMTVGSIAYTAPQQFGDEVDGRADRYALAATAYHLLQGDGLVAELVDHVADVGKRPR